MNPFAKKLTSLLLALFLCINLLPVTHAAGTEATEQPALEISAPDESLIGQSTPAVTENSSIPPMLHAEPAPANAGATRYTVLLLDVESAFDMTSGGEIIYSVETPIDTIRAAASRFIDQIQSANGTNYVAVVSYASTANVECDFSTDSKALNDAIDDLTVRDFGANINAAFLEANELLEQITDANATKNIVLFTQGVNGSGNSTNTGPYTEDDCTWVRSDTNVHIYAYSNATYNTAQSLMADYNLYSIGLFQSFDRVPEAGRSLLTFAKRFTEDLQNKGFYDVDNIDDLEFTFGEVAGDLTAQPYTFSFTGHLVPEEDVEAICYYSDGYFLRDSSTYNSHLATMSLCFELSTWSRSDESGADWTTTVNSSTDARVQNAYDLLTKLGFSDFTANDFWKAKPTKDSIGAVAAYKEDLNLIALGVRGGGYAQEWASNFTVGKEGEHDGFSEAKDNVLAFLKKFISDNGITGDIKLWIVGYSRAGCVANMVAGELNNGYNLGNASVAHDDLFAYTFEAPQGALKSVTAKGDHSNIHNVINLNDIVPLVAPSSWGFDRYNTDRWLPSAATTDSFTRRLSNMLDIYADFENSDENGDGKADYAIQEYGTQFEIKINWSKILPFGDPFISIDYYSVPTETLLLETASFLFDGVIGDRETYYYDFQAGVREIMSLIYGGSLSDLLKEGISPEEFFTRFLEEFTVERIVEIVKPMFALNLDSFDTRKDKVKENLEDFIKDVLNNSDLWGTVMFVADLGDTLTDTMWRLFETVLKDLFDKDTKSLQSLVNVITMLGGIGQAHYPEITLAWIMSQDSYYQEGQTDFSVSSSRIVHINCPVDVKIYRETTGELVASFVDDVPQNIQGSSIYAYVNADGEKVVILPTDAEYTVEITATDAGTLNYTIDEFNWDGLSNSRILNYADIAIEENDVLTGALPAFPESELETPTPDGSSVEYTLIGNDGVEIVPDVDISGSDAEDAVFTVSLSTNNEFGSITGGGTYTLGSFTEVEASPVTGATFEGWYQGNTLISKDSSYRFAVLDNVDLVAHFSEAEAYTLTVIAGDGGRVANEQISVSAGTLIQLEAIANEGYTFRRWSADSGTIENAASAATWFTMPDSDATVKAEFTANAPAEKAVSRIYGKTRYETSFSIADKMKETLDVDKFDNIIIASGTNFADALAGSYLAAAKNAPILITNGSNATDLTAYISENWTSDGSVYILGGTAAVPAGIEQSLKDAGIKTTRLSGKTRFDTNLQILQEAGFAGGELLVATGYNFADSLSVSATGLPILMVNNNTGALTESQIAYLKELEDVQFTIIGGTGAVSEKLADKLETYGDVQRISGKNREETSVKVAQQYFSSPEYIVLAYSRNFPDGLCGGPLAYALGAPLILTQTGSENAAATYCTNNQITKGYALGGTAALSDNTINTVFHLK